MNKNQLGQMTHRIDHEQREVSRSIMATPSGELRNKLSDLNIHLLQALSDIDDLVALTKEQQ